jgi:GNAT superfamily N-acetyltransferase
MNVEIANEADIREIIALAKMYDGGFSRHVRVDVSHATETYLEFVADGRGVVFAAKQDGKNVGGLAAIRTIDINGGFPLAVELFWFILPEHRGGGMLLLDAFESWASEQGCEKMAMIHLSDSMPDVLQKVYERRGYELVEMHYVKEIPR